VGEVAIAIVVHVHGVRDFRIMQIGGAVLVEILNEDLLGKIDRLCRFLM